MGQPIPIIENMLHTLIDTYNKKIDINSSITSVYLYGSYIRGDFIPSKSDLDFAVF